MPFSTPGDLLSVGMKLSSLASSALAGASLVTQMVKNLPAKQGLIPGSGILSGEGNGYPFQCSCLENSMDRGDWQTIVHGVTESRTRLSNVHFHFPTISATLGAGTNHYSLSKSRVPSKSTSLLQLDRAIRLFLANVL